jgi:hypothetical protein
MNEADLMDDWDEVHHGEIVLDMVDPGQIGPGVNNAAEIGAALMDDWDQSALGQIGPGVNNAAEIGVDLGQIILGVDNAENINDAEINADEAAIDAVDDNIESTEEEDDDRIENALTIRNTFAGLMNLIVETTVTESVEVRPVKTSINTFIDRFITTHNTETMVCAKYGGRSWAYHMADIEDLTPIQRSSVLNGNFDIFILTEQELTEAKIDDIYAKIDVISKLIEISIERIKRDPELNKLYNLEDYDIIHSHYKTYDCRTISCGYGFMTSLYKKKGTNPSTFMGPSDNNKLLFYVEIGLLPIKSIPGFKEYFIDTVNPTFISLLGLFTIYNFMEKPRTDKNILLDQTRHQLFIKEKLASLITAQTQANIFGLIIKIFIVIFPEIFIKDGFIKDGIPSTFYKTKQSKIIFLLFEKFNVQVAHLTEPGTPIIYSEWLKQFNNQLLDSPGGGSGNLKLPSLRQIINWLFIYLDHYFGDCRIEESGGDAIRHYLYDSIQYTSDIDAKFFYTGNFPEDKQNKIILILTFINKFLKDNNYFKFKLENTILVPGFGNWLLTIDSTKQEYCTSIRLLRNFIVPLISLDIRLNVYLKFNEYIYKSIYYFSPLDIAFKKSKNDIIRDKKRNNKVIQQLHANPETTFSGVVKEMSDGYEIYLTPLPTLEYLRDDIKELIENPVKRAQRVSVGKDTKDLERFTLFQQMITDGNTDLPASSYKLEQIHEIPKKSHLNIVKNQLFSIIKKILDNKTDYYTLINSDLTDYVLLESDLADLKFLSLCIITHAGKRKKFHTAYSTDIINAHIAEGKKILNQIHYNNKAAKFRRTSSMTRRSTNDANVANKTHKTEAKHIRKTEQPRKLTTSSSIPHRKLGGNKKYIKSKKNKSKKNKSKKLKKCIQNI